MTKGVAHVGKGKSLSSGEANENERRGWSEESYRRKNQQNINNYDWSRHDLNFEVVKGQIKPLGSQQVSLYQRYNNLLKSLDYKQYKDSATNKQHSYVEIILSGSTERMQKIAFADQIVNYERNPKVWHNWGVTRTQAIEEWALDVYKFACQRYGEVNIIGFEVHLDETEPHIHCNIVPTAIKKQRGNISGFHKIDADGNPVTYTKGKHIGEVIKISEKKYNELSDEKKKEYRKNERGTVRVLSYATHFGDKSKERSEIMSDLHDKYYEQVGKKWGFERGDVIAELPEEERATRKHYTKQQRRNIELAQKAQANAEKKTIQKETELIRVTAAVDRQTEKLKEQSSTLEQQQVTISDNQAQIDQQQEKLRKLTNGSMFDKMFHSGLTSEVKKAFEEKDEQHKQEMRQATMATYPNGNPIVWGGGKKKGIQLTWEEYAKWLRDHNEKERANKQEEIEQAKAEAKRLRVNIDNLKEQHKNELGNRDNIIYRLWPEARNAVKAIFELGSSPTSKDFTTQQAQDVKNAIIARSGIEPTDAAMDLLGLAQKDFEKHNTSKGWIEGAAKEVISIAQDTHQGLKALMGQQSKDGGGGTSYITDLTGWDGKPIHR